MNLLHGWINYKCLYASLFSNYLLLAWSAGWRECGNWNHTLRQTGFVFVFKITSVWHFTRLDDGKRLLQKMYLRIFTETEKRPILTKLGIQLWLHFSSDLKYFAHCAQLIYFAHCAQLIYDLSNFYFLILKF